VHLKDRLEAFSDIALVVIEAIVNLRPRDAEIIELVVRQGDAVVADRKLLAGAVERDLVRGMLAQPLLQVGAE
jgi:hypothetical protein